ncbi:hypothetical protein E2542_SST09557 [Spatholobus suberectus]|nr:hypothetical protein E2542_SST09557 [Spatholobus suberectus]
MLLKQQLLPRVASPPRAEQQRRGHGLNFGQHAIIRNKTTIGPSYLVNDIRCCVSVLGWVGFFYTMWLVTRKSLGFAKRSLSVTGSAITSTLLLGLPITFHPKIQFRRWSHIEACVQILHMHVLKWQKLLLLTGRVSYP